jgi:hypothetical protein
MPGWRPVAVAGAALWGSPSRSNCLRRLGVAGAGAAGRPILAVALNALVALRFAWTLRPGAVPLITRYARADAMGLPREAEGYTRALTALWAGLIGAFALAQAGPPSTSGPRATCRWRRRAPVSRCSWASTRCATARCRSSAAPRPGGRCAPSGRRIVRPEALTNRAPDEVICHHGRRGPVTVERFLHEAAALAARLPAGAGHAVDLCEDRYLSLLGFAAAALRGHPVMLGGGRGAASRFLPIAAGFAGAYVLADADLPGSPLPVLRADQPGEAPFLPLPLALRAIPPGQLAAIAFTSGSTGAPAAHAKPWGALLHGAAPRPSASTCWTRPASLVATVPPQHMYGFETTIMLPLRAPVAIHSGAAFFPSDVLGALEAVPPRRVLVTTPLHLRALLGAPLGAGRPAPLAAVISATAPLGRDLAEAVERGWATPMLEIYGATEAGSMASRRTLMARTGCPIAASSCMPAPPPCRVAAR